MRLAVTLTGIVLAIVLIVVRFGLFLGFQFQDTSAKVTGHSRAPGPQPDMYAFSRRTAQRNLDRIPLP